MNYVTVVWSCAAGAALLLAVAHAWIWVFDRRARASLALAIATLGVAGVAITEMGMMFSRTPGEWSDWVRWCHAPMFLLFVGVASFIHLYFGTGRMWMLRSFVALRLLILVANFAGSGNFNFESVSALRSMDFLGEQVAVVSAAVTGRWQWLATLSNLVLIAYVVDASLSLWRRGTPGSRHRVLVVGGAMTLSVTCAILCTQLVIWRFVDMPMLITPPYLLSVLAMVIELGRDTLHNNLLSRQLRESEYRLGLAADSAQLGLWGWEAGTGLAWATARARELFGLESGEPLLPTGLQRLVHEQDLPRLQGLLRDSGAQDSRFTEEFRIRRADGSIRWLAVSGSIERMVPGGPAQLRGVVRDVSDRKQAAQEAELLRREVSHSGRVTMLGRLVSSLAHELSQPLSAILRNVEAADLILRQHSPNEDELRAIVQDIHRDDRRAADIIDKLRTLLKRREVQLQPLVVESLVKDAGTLVRADAAARHVAVEFATSETLPLIAGDRVHLSQVLINLLQNGIDASCDSKGARCVTVAAQETGAGAVEISVSDSGPGIGIEAMDKVFEPFFTTKPGGMGMGLSVSRTIVEAHGGRIWAENRGGGGAVFRLQLPAVAA